MDAGEAQGVGHLDLTKGKCMSSCMYICMFLNVSIIDSLLDASILMYINLYSDIVYIRNPLPLKGDPCGRFTHALPETSSRTFILLHVAYGIRTGSTAEILKYLGGHFGDESVLA